VVASYFRKQRIERIIFLTKPYRARPRGCIYFIIKFQMVAATLGVCLAAFYAVYKFKEDIAEALSMDQSVVEVTFLAILLVFATSGAFFAIDFLEKKWRRRLEKDDTAKTIDLRKTLEKHRDCPALTPFSQRQVAVILEKPGRIEDHLGEYSNYELILIEDALLYGFETQGIMSGFSYGLRIIYAMMFFFFVVVFSTLYSYTEVFVRAQFGAHKSGPILLLVFLVVGMYAICRASNRSHYFWDLAGVLGRCYARLSVYYWPVTLGLWGIANALYKTYVAFQ
jgi:hypothetical protein